MNLPNFEIAQLCIAENIKQCIPFNTECVKNMAFAKVGSNFSIFKQALEIRPNKFYGICGSKDVEMTICLK